jgi:hypothetical protein
MERQDIDALLIGALYGELTPADEARLNAHLESHPGDKSALADLTTARNAVRESRFLTVQIEPPQAVSALLLQEASRRAPAKVVGKDKQESWFARFVSSFARHPAMAAAAMLVLVVGVAGTMYLRNGKQDLVAQQSTETFGADRVPAAAAPSAADQGVLEEAKELRQQAGSSFNATLAEPSDKLSKGDASIATERPRDSDAKKREAAAVATPPKAAANRTYIGVQAEPSPQPKEIESKEQSNAESDSRRSRGAGVSTGGSAPGVARNEKSDPAIATPAPPPPVAPRAQQTTTPRGGEAVGGDALRDGQNQKSDEEAGWAREQHVKVANAVKANNCKDATTIAVQISSRAPGYYKENVEGDRELKKCVAYINVEREKEELRLKAARALQKKQADEAERSRRAAPTTDSK